jgi:hypothetical protein
VHRIRRRGALRKLPDAVLQRFLLHGPGPFVDLGHAAQTHHPDRDRHCHQQQDDPETPPEAGRDLHIPHACSSTAANAGPGHGGLSAGRLRNLRA